MSSEVTKEEEEEKKNEYWKGRMEKNYFHLNLFKRSENPEFFDLAFQEYRDIIDHPDFQLTKFGREFNDSMLEGLKSKMKIGKDRKEGNKYVKEGNYDKAIEFYTRGIRKGIHKFDLKERKYPRCSHELAVHFANRSEMFLQKGEYFNSLLDGLSVVECLMIPDRSTDVNFMYSRVSQDLVLKTRIRLSRTFSNSFGNYAISNQLLSRCRGIRNLGEKWVKKLNDEQIRIGKMFWKKKQIYCNPKWESRPDFNKFCLNSKNVRKIPLKMTQELLEHVQFRKFNSFSFDRKSSVGYIFGGRTRHFSQVFGLGLAIYNNDFLILDPKEPSLVKVDQYGDIPCTRAHHKTVLYKNKMYLFGGENIYFREPDPSCGTTPKLDPFYVLDLKTKYWKKLQVPDHIKDQFGRILCLQDHSMVSIEERNCMYIYGGAISRPWTDPRTKHRYDLYEKLEQGHLYRYCFLSQKWDILTTRFDYSGYPQKYPDIPLPRKRAAMWEMNDSLYLWGGEACEQTENYVNSFGESERAPKDDIANITSFGQKGTVRFNDRTYHHYQRCWRFDLDLEKWERLIQTGSPPSKRSEFNVFVFENKAFLFGGYASEGMVKDPKNPDIVTTATGEKRAIFRNYSYFRDCFEFSLWNAPGNELIGRKGLLKKTVHWRRILFPIVKGDKGIW